LRGLHYDRLASARPFGSPWFSFRDERYAGLHTNRRIVGWNSVSPNVVLLNIPKRADARVAGLATLPDLPGGATATKPNAPPHEQQSHSNIVRVDIARSSKPSPQQVLLDGGAWVARGVAWWLRGNFLVVTYCLIVPSLLSFTLLPVGFLVYSVALLDKEDIHQIGRTALGEVSFGSKPPAVSMKTTKNWLFWISTIITTFLYYVLFSW
jgi:hypothetical protein